MKIIAKTGNPDIAEVYIAESEEGKLIEFVQSVEPPIPKEKKWVLIISTLFGCPVKCKFCDSGEFYKGKLSAEQMIEQIDYLVLQSFPDRSIPIDKFKIQFARMGEPAFNPAVLDVLEQLPKLYNAPGLIPSVSTIAPAGTESFFDRLTDIKNTFYNRNFQMQFSLHSTDEKQRNELMPVKKWSFSEIADYAKGFYRPGDRKVTLNFAVAKDSIIQTDVLLKYFSPELFFIKITPVNPTFKANLNKIDSYIEKDVREYALIEELKTAGYDVLLSFGEIEENNIGSNCGQNILNYLKSQNKLDNSYTYELEYLK